MASYSQRGDQTIAQVRRKRNGVAVFSESKLFATEALARSWGTRLAAKVRQEGIAMLVGVQRLASCVSIFNLQPLS